MSAMCAIPCTTVQKMIGAISIRIALMKASPSGCIVAARSGLAMPSAMPSPIAIRTCTHSSFDQYLVLKFRFRREQRNQVDEIAVVRHHLDVRVRPIGAPDDPVDRRLDDLPGERHRVGKGRAGGGDPFAAAHLD